MKKWRWLAIVVITAICFLSVSAGESIPYIKVKQYNKNATWKYEECTYCNGTGFVQKKKYDAKRNRTIIYVVACPYCHGTGKHGMSKK